MIDSRKRFAAVAAALVALTALLMAGCGSGGTSSTAATTGGGAAIAPASAAAFVSIVTDQSSSQWQSANALLDKFPAKQQLLDSVRQSASKNGVDLQKLLSTVGPELDVVVLADGSTVELAKPTDPTAFVAALPKGSTPAVHTTVDGWTVFSDKQAALDAFSSEAAKGKLGADSSYQAATAKLSSGAVVKVYVNGAQAMQAPQAKQLQQVVGNGKLTWLAAEAVPGPNGLKLDGSANVQGGTGLTPLDSSFLDEAPSGALAVLAFDGKGLAGRLQSAGSGSGGGTGSLQQVLPLLQQVGGLLAGDNLLYVRGGGLVIPEVTILTTPASAQDGVATLDKLLGSLGGLGAQAKPVTIGSAQAKELNLGRFSIYYGADGNHLVVSDAQQGFTRGANGKLSGDPNFKQAKSESGLPDSVDGLLYVDLKDALPLVESLAQLGGSSIPPTVLNNLQPLRSLTAWAGGTSDQPTFTVFLGIG